MTTTTSQTLATTRAAVADSLGIDVTEVGDDQTLFGDLELESIDLLDVFFRIEQANGVSISAEDLAAHLQGGIDDSVFSNDADVISPVGLDHLERAIPGFRREELSEPLRADAILELVTVLTLAVVVDSHRG